MKNKCRDLIDILIAFSRAIKKITQKKKEKKKEAKTKLTNLSVTNKEFSCLHCYSKWSNYLPYLSLRLNKSVL